MSKQRVDKYVETEVLNGKSHQEIFNHIATTSDFKVQDIAEIVRKVPTLEKRKEYKALNTVLLVILGLVILNRVILVFQLMNELNSSLVSVLLPLVSILMFYGILKFKRNVHLAAGFLMTFGSITAIIRLISLPDIITIINVLVTLIGAIIAFYLSVKLVSDYEVDKELQENNPAQRENVITFIN